MRFTLIYALLLTAAASAAADPTPSFSDRVKRAKFVEQQSAPRAYMKQYLFPAMSSSMSSEMKKCLAQPGASREKFVLVADIGSTGDMSSVDYRPKTNTAACFAAAFRTLRLPAPPKCESGSLPIYIEMTLTEQ